MIEFVNMHRYVNIEKFMYDYVINYKPKTVVELGHGSSAVTVALAKGMCESNIDGIIHSYDFIDCNTKYNCMGKSKYSHESAYDRVNNRGLSNYVKFTSGDVFKTFVKNPFMFDLLFIDIDNTWDDLYSILILNKTINSFVKSGSSIIIEGGDDNHPRINKESLNNFNNKIGYSVFEMKYITGSGRTSISKLDVL